MRLPDQPLEGFPALPQVERAPEMSERDLLVSVISTARILGYRVAHFRSVPVKRGKRIVWQTPVQADGAGFPDLCLVGHGRILWRELKVGRNTLSAEQADWIAALHGAGADVGVWTGSDWHSGLIEAELRRATKHERNEAA